MVLLLAVSVAAEAPPDRPAPVFKGARVAPLDKVGDAVLAATNRARRKNGRSALKAKLELTEAAADQAAYMALMLKTEHASRILGQSDALQRVHRHGYYATTVAENILSFKLEPTEDPSTDELATRIVDLWLGSPGHRVNLLRRDMSQLGCAVRFIRLLDGGQAVFAAQVFAP